MNRISSSILVALFFGTVPVMAQPYGYLSPSSRTEEAAVAPAAQIPQQMELETTTQTLDAFIPEGLEGRVQRGVLPQLFSRDYGKPQVASGTRSNGRQRRGQQQAIQRSTGRSANSGRRTNNSSSTSGSAGEVRAFVDNAFKFDTNGDRKLAAHELSSLFLVLTSTLNAENTDPSNSANRSPLAADESLIQRDRIRQAETAFLQLALSFDSNSDGALSSGEVASLAGCVQQNNFSLTDAALQNEERRSQTVPVQPTPVQRQAVQPQPAQPAPESSAPAPTTPN